MRTVRVVVHSHVHGRRDRGCFAVDVGDVAVVGVGFGVEVAVAAEGAALGAGGAVLEEGVGGGTPVVLGRERTGLEGFDVRFGALGGAGEGEGVRGVRTEMGG